MLARLIRSNAQRSETAPAVFLGKDVKRTQGEVARRVAALAGALRREFGLRHGDRVAICMDNVPEYLEVLFATWWAGLTAVPVNHKLHFREVDFILNDSGASFSFCSDSLAIELSGLSNGRSCLRDHVDVHSSGYGVLLETKPIPMKQVAPSDAAWLFYTSGTTGKPKGAVLSHRNLLAMILGYLADIDSIADGDRWLVAAPFSHGCGLYALPFVARGCPLVFPESGGFNPEEVIELVNAHPGLSSFFVPTMIKRLLDDPAITNIQLQNLKTLVYGGGPMYVEDCLRALGVLGPRLVQIYGQGETPMTITCLTKQDHVDDGRADYLSRLGSVGRAQLVVEVDIVNESGESLPAGEAGEIIVKGDTVMSGYWQNESATKDTLRDGWLYTGDLGVMDAQGYLTLKDRSKDLIISGGSNIYPREIEEVLMQHPRVHEVAVTGRPHPDWGEEVVAFLVADDQTEALAEELDLLCREQLARFKRPRAYFRETSLPKNAVGKVLKKSLREKLEPVNTGEGNHFSEMNSSGE